MSTEKLLFITLYVMLGDADGSIEGHRIVTETEWNAEVEAFEKFLEEKDIAEVECDSVWGIYYMGLDGYTIQECTPEEAAVLEKFIGKNDGEFKLPSEFIEECIQND